MAKTKNTKNMPQEASLFFFDDEEEELVVEQEEPMPDIDIVLPEKKSQPQPQEVKKEEKPRHKMRFISFGSGSSGNCAYVGNETGGILIDAGVDSDDVFAALRDNGVTSDMVRAIVLTHDHGDHVRYAYKTVRKYKHIRIYCTPRLMNGMLRRHNISRRIKDYQENIYKEIPFKILDFTLTAFETSHDGSDNMGFHIESEGQAFVVATDMGCVTARAAHYIVQADYLMLESNYDLKMLNECAYPEYLKQRIRKDTGHLDNVEAARFVSENYTPKLRYLFLCHLSKDTNTPEIALTNMRETLEAKGITVGDCSNSVEMRGKDLQLYALPRYDASPLIILTD